MTMIHPHDPAPFVHGGHVYVRAPKPIHFPCDVSLEDRVPETRRHLEARTTLYLFLRDAIPGAAVGCDQFVYWDPRDPRKCLSPDGFVKLHSPNDAFDVWKVWERGAPEVAVEIVSASDQGKIPWAEKLERYEACGVRELVRFDADAEERPIRVWDRVEGELVERAPDDPELRACTTLGLHWVVGTSTYGPQLRLARDREGRDLLLTAAEDLARERIARAQVEHERRLAEEARLREAEARAAAERELAAALAELARLRSQRGNPDGS